MRFLKPFLLEDDPVVKINKLPGEGEYMGSENRYDDPN
jgi:hypothetical protein